MVACFPFTQSIKVQVHMVWLDMAASMAMAELDMAGLVKMRSIPGGEPIPGYGWTRLVS